MKHILSFVLVLGMIFSATVVSAEECMLFSMDDIDAVSLSVEETDEDVFQKLEKRLIEAWANLDENVNISDLNIKVDDALAMYLKVYFENPLFYYIDMEENRPSVYYNPLTDIATSIVFEYLEDNKKKIEDTWEKIDKATEEILLYISPDMTDFEKVMAVHDYMVLNYVYDIDDLDQTMLIILDKSGVCAAYSEVFVHMMNTLGIEATVIRSPEKNGGMGHMWNLVKLDGQWYHIDVTWDDPVKDRYGCVYHQFALLSTQGIIERGHYGFDMGDYTADSTLYDNAPWRNSEGAIVSVQGTTYYVSGNDLVDENDKVIYAKLDGGDGRWNLQKGYLPGYVFAGLCEINEVLYFNTDGGIYSYNPSTEETEQILNKNGICGLFADGNTLRYNTFDGNKREFVESGKMKIGDMKIEKPSYENGKAVVRVYNDSAEPLWVFSNGDTNQCVKITDGGMNTVKFDNGEEQTIYIWDSKLRPIVEKTVVRK